MEELRRHLSLGSSQVISLCLMLLQGGVAALYFERAASRIPTPLAAPHDQPRAAPKIYCRERLVRTRKRGIAPTDCGREAVGPHAPFWPNRLVHQLLAALPTSRVIGAVPEFSDFVGHFRNSIETSAGSQSRPPTRRCSRATARMPEAVDSACEAVERCSSLAGGNAATNP